MRRTTTVASSTQEESTVNMPNPTQRRGAVVCAIVLSALTLPLHTASLSHAAASKQASNANNASSGTAKKSRSVKVKPQQNHSGETTSERDRRLYRECKGMPNAGACLGYTRR